MTPLIEKALVDLLLNPPVIAGDVNRTDAAAQLGGLDYGVYVASRPQGSEAMAITVERAGGIPVRNVDSTSGRKQSIMDLTFWSRDTQSNRANVAPVLELMQLIEVVLPGYRSVDLKGVTIADVVLESEPFTSDEAPRDKSDGWMSRFTMSYLVYWRKLDASHVVVRS